MKKYSKLKKLIILVTVVGISYGTYAKFIKKPADATTVTISSKVRKGTIEDSIKVTGTAKLVDEQKIRFNQLGKVSALHFKEGQQVKKGQLIAELDKSDADNSIRQAEISLNNSKIKLAEDLKPLEYKDMLKSESDIAKQESDLINASNSLQNLVTEKDNKLFDIGNQISSKKSDISSKKSNLKLAREQLAVLEKQEGQNVSNIDIDTRKIIDTAFSDIRKYLLDAQTHLNSADVAFGYSEANKYLNDGYEIYISAKNPQLKKPAESDWNNSNILMANLKKKYDNTSSDRVNSADIKELLNDAITLYDSLIMLGNDSAEAIRMSIPSGAYTQSQIDSSTSSMLQIKSSAQGSYDSMKNTLNNINKLTDPELQKLTSSNNIAKQRNTISDLEISLNTAENDLKSLENSLLQTTKNYEAQITQSNLNLENLHNSIAVSKANFEYLKKGATDEQIARDRNDIAKQEIALADSKKNLEKYEISAPFDGLVRQIDFKVGDNLVSDDTKYVYIDNPNLIEITAQLDQIDIAKIRIGQDAKIVFDPFPKQEFEGKITQINTTPIQASGVTSYEIKITMDKKEFAIYSGMTSKIDIVLDKKEDVLIIPASFVTKRRGIPTVQLDDGTGSGKTTEIVTGISTNTFIEVVEGLKEGDKILRTIKTSTGSTTTTLIGNGPGGGAGRTRSSGSDGAGGRPN